MNFSLNRIYLNKNETRITKVSVGKFTDISNFQHLIENFLSSKNSQTKLSEIGKCSYAFIDDLNLVPSEGPNVLGCLRSFMIHKGWYSQNKSNKFTKLDKCNFLAAYSSEQSLTEDFLVINLFFL